MSLRNLPSGPITGVERLSPTSRMPMKHGGMGHPHFRERALSRRSFLRGTALAAGAAIGSQILFPPLTRALAKPKAGPTPIPGGIQPFGPGTELFHVFPPARGVEPASIFNFNGSVGLAQVQGSWSGGGVVPPAGTPLVYEADMRFMSGEYVAEDGRPRNGTFGFV